MTLELRDEKIVRLEAGRPFVRLEVEAMSVVVSSFEEKTLRREMDLQGMADEQIHRVPPLEKGIGRTASSAADAERPYGRCEDDRGHQAGHQGQLVPWRGLSQGGGALGTHESIGLLANSCRGQPVARALMTGPSSPRRWMMMWGTDMTTTALSTGKQVAVFVAIEYLSAASVGLHTFDARTRFEALLPILQEVREHFGAIDQSVAAG